MTTTYVPTRGERFAALAVPSWLAHPDRSRDAADWLHAEMNAFPMSDCAAVSLSWCIRKVSALRADVIAGSRRIITYRDPVGEKACNHIVYGGGAR